MSKKYETILSVKCMGKVIEALHDCLECHMIDWYTIEPETVKDINLIVSCDEENANEVGNILIEYGATDFEFRK